MANTLRRPDDDVSPSALDRRARLHRRARLVVLASVVGYFFLPHELKTLIPVWLLFAAALGLELEFFVGGWLQTRRGVEPAEVDRGPQPRDLAELGPQYEEFEPLSLFPSDWYTEPKVAPHREWRYVAEAAAGLAIVAVVLFFAVRPSGWDAVSSENRARTEATLSRAAGLVAGHEVEVTCDDRGQFVGFVQDADGAAEVGGRQAFLTPGICDTLYQLAVKDRVQSFARTGRAIAVLAHEAQHLRGVRDEGLANCYGFRSGVEIGVELGLAEERARAMMRAQLATNARDSARNSEYRVPRDCRVD